MVRAVLAGLLLVCSCAPRGAVVATPLDVSIRHVAAEPLVTTEEVAQDDGRAVGDGVEVEWRGSWWPATLLERRGARWLIHYDGYESEWDEVVGLERIRDRRPAEDEEPPPPFEDDVDP